MPHVAGWPEWTNGTKMTTTPQFAASLALAPEGWTPPHSGRFPEHVCPTTTKVQSGDVIPAGRYLLTDQKANTCEARLVRVASVATRVTSPDPWHLPGWRLDPA